jgi:hypothetical protein
MASALSDASEPELKDARVRFGNKVLSEIYFV